MIFLGVLVNLLIFSARLAIQFFSYRRFRHALIQIKLNATNENAEQIGDLLMEETGALSVTFLDAQDTPVFEPLPVKLAYGVTLTSLHFTTQRLIQVSF